jgi:hypothetical protein
MRRLTILLAALVAAFAVGACGVGAGERSSEVQLLVTRDFGEKEIGRVPPAETNGSETVMRYLRRSFDVETRYGGGFVQSIEGLGGGREDGRPVDWFYYVNGVEADKGSTSTKLQGGDRIWWDRHDWGASMRTPAVVGSYPEPFKHGLGGKRWPTRVECVKNGDKDACEAIADRLGDDGILAARSLTGTSGGTAQLRIVVGPWADVRSDYAARMIEEGPQVSGVFATFTRDGKQLQLLDPRGEVVRTVGSGGGLIAATRWEDQPPTWFVTGTDAAGVAAAVQAFDEGTLANRFALAVADERGVPLPVRASSP